MIRYVEVPVAQERIRERRVDKPTVITKEIEYPEISYYDNVVQIPYTQFEDHPFETTRVEQNVINVPTLQHVGVPYERVEMVEEPKTIVLDRIVNRPDPALTQYIDRPRREFVDRNLPFYHHQARHIPVSQVYEPKVMLNENENYLVHHQTQWVPRIIPFDIYIPKLVDVPLYDNAQVEVTKYAVDIPWEHTRYLEANLNPDLDETLTVPDPSTISKTWPHLQSPWDDGIANHRPNTRAPPQRTRESPRVDVRPFFDNYQVPESRNQTVNWRGQNDPRYQPTRTYSFTHPVDRPRSQPPRHSNQRQNGAEVGEYSYIYPKPNEDATSYSVSRPPDSGRHLVIRTNNMPNSR